MVLWGKSWKWTVAHFIATSRNLESMPLLRLQVDQIQGFSDGFMNWTKSYNWSIRWQNASTQILNLKSNMISQRIQKLYVLLLCDPWWLSYAHWTNPVLSRYRHQMTHSAAQLHCCQFQTRLMTSFLILCWNKQVRCETFLANSLFFNHHFWRLQSVWIGHRSTLQ